MASCKKNIIKQKGVSLNILTSSSAKRIKIQHVTCSIRNATSNVHDALDNRPDEFEASNDHDEPLIDDYKKPPLTAN